MDGQKTPETGKPRDPGRKNERTRSARKTSASKPRRPTRAGGRPEPEGVMTDRDRLTELEKKLKGATRRLETLQAAGKRQRDFLSAQTHQIRAKLHAVLGYTELVLRKNRNLPPMPQEENLKKLLICAEGLKTAIEGLAEFPWVDRERSISRKRS